MLTLGFDLLNFGKHDYKFGGFRRRNKLRNGFNTAVRCSMQYVSCFELKLHRILYQLCGWQ